MQSQRSAKSKYKNNPRPKKATMHVDKTRKHSDSSAVANFEAEYKNKLADFKAHQPKASVEREAHNKKIKAKSTCNNIATFSRNVMPNGNGEYVKARRDRMFKGPIQNEFDTSHSLDQVIIEQILTLDGIVQFQFSTCSCNNFKMPFGSFRNVKSEVRQCQACVPCSPQRFNTSCFRKGSHYSNKVVSADIRVCFVTSDFNLPREDIYYAFKMWASGHTQAAFNFGVNVLNIQQGLKMHSSQYTFPTGKVFCFSYLGVFDYEFLNLVYCLLKLKSSHRHLELCVHEHAIYSGRKCYLRLLSLVAYTDFPDGFSSISKPTCNMSFRIVHNNIVAAKDWCYALPLDLKVAFDSSGCFCTDTNKCKVHSPVELIPGKGIFSCVLSGRMLSCTLGCQIYLPFLVNALMNYIEYLRSCSRATLASFGFNPTLSTTFMNLSPGLTASCFLLLKDANGLPVVFSGNDHRKMIVDFHFSFDEIERFVFTCVCLLDVDYRGNSETLSADTFTFSKYDVGIHHNRYGSSFDEKCNPFRIIYDMARLPKKDEFIDSFDNSQIVLDNCNSNATIHGEHFF